LVIIADDVSGDALATFIVNKLKGTFNVLAVKAPGYGDRKKEMLADIATVVGAQVITEDLGLKFENTTLAMLGKAARVTATKDSTTIVGGKGKKADLEARMSQIRAQIESTESKFDKENLEKRLAKLSGGVAVISVGAATETEMKYLKDKIDDAVKATKASIEEGIVAGGGTALVKVAKKLSPDTKLSADEKAGFEIVMRALEVPLRQIVQNAGKDDVSMIVAKVQMGAKNAGYDAVKDEIVEDMLVAGIVDPAKMPRMALENAVSAAAMLLTMEAAIADIPEPKKESAGGGMGEMDY
jgi:chaperonin GroEL